MMNPSPILEVSGLEAQYGETPILQGADFTLQPAEVVAIIGRNGVGKTTLMKCLIGLLPATGGTILYNGRDITRIDAYARARIGMGYIPQGRGLFPRMTVSENLSVGELIGGPGKPKLYDLIFEFFPILADRKNQIAGTMSGGQQQMLSIARALVGNPSLILLDEPSEGIQPSIVHEIGTNMRKISQQLGMAIILVEQNIHMIHALAQRCYVMKKGRIVKEATSDELDDPETVRSYLSA